MLHEQLLKQSREFYEEFLKNSYKFDASFFSQGFELVFRQKHLQSLYPKNGRYNIDKLQIIIKNPFSFIQPIQVLNTSQVTIILKQQLMHINGVYKASITAYVQLTLIKSEKGPH